MAVPEVTIVLSSYNGERYIAEQIESIIHQTYKEWELLIRDDGSTDKTREIVRSYIEKDTRIRLMDDTRHLGIRDSFNELFCAVRDRPYVMYADQDDVWLPEKIYETYKHMKNVEAPDKPILVYSPRKIVNTQLCAIAARDPYLRTDFKSVLAQCPLFGCTVMINQALLQCATPIPSFVYMPDYWLALIACTKGELFRYNRPLILYRLHDNNLSGGKNNYAFINKIRSWKKSSERLYNEIKQNISFCNTIPLDAKYTSVAQAYASVFKSKGIRRIIAISKLRPKKNHLLATWRLVIAMILI